MRNIRNPNNFYFYFFIEIVHCICFEDKPSKKDNKCKEIVKMLTPLCKSNCSLSYPRLLFFTPLQCLIDMLHKKKTIKASCNLSLWKRSLFPSQSRYKCSFATMLYPMVHIILVNEIMMFLI